MALTIRLYTGRRITVEADSVLIGRDRACQIALPDETALQPIHARIRKIANRWMVEAQGDWQIQVGTGLPGRMNWLKPGDLIRLTESGPEITFEEAPVLVQSLAVSAPIPTARKQQPSPTPQTVVAAPVAAPAQQVPSLPAEVDDWFYTSAGQKCGPFSADQLKQLAEAGVLLPEDMIWQTGMPGWVAAHSIPAFFSDIPSHQPTPVQPTVQHPPARTPSVLEANGSQPVTGKKPTPFATHQPPGLVPPLVGMQVVVGVALVLGLYGLLGIIKDDVDTRNGVLIALTVLHCSLTMVGLVQTMFRSRRFHFTVLATLLTQTCWAWLVFSNIPVAIPLLGMLAAFGMGTWALAVLKNPEVRSHFSVTWIPAEDRWQRFSAPAIAGIIGGGAMVAILCVGFLLWFGTRERPQGLGAGPREHRDQRDVKEPRDVREERDVRDPRDVREERKVKEPREIREPRKMREPRTIKSRTGESQEEIREAFGKEDTSGPKEMQERYKALVERIKPGMSTNQVKSILGVPDKTEAKDLGKLNPQKAGQTLEIWTWRDKSDSKSFIMLSFVNGSLEDGGTPGYDIRKGFKSK